MFRKWISFFLALVLLASVTLGVQAASTSNYGITLYVPDNFESCAPSSTAISVTTSGVGDRTVNVWFFYYDPATNYSTPVAMHTLTGDVSLPFPYPATIEGTRYFVARVDVFMPDGSLLTKVEWKWSVSCTTPPTPPPPSGGQGCTPGYWKNHLDSWPATGFSTSADFDATFGVNYFNPNITLGEAIRLGGGGYNKIARHGTAALLSASHPGVNYPYTVAQVIAYVQSGDVEPLVSANELGCNLN